MISALLALSLSGASAFAGCAARAPAEGRSAVCMSGAASSRRAALATFAAAAALPALSASAEVATSAAPALMSDPNSYKLKKDYPADARQMLNNMVLATDLARGTPNMENTVKATRSEMNDFVAFYRRQPKVAGMPSFSTMYTAINTLSGHYASYGNKYPVPE